MSETSNSGNDPGDGAQSEETPAFKDLREKAKRLTDVERAHEALLRENMMLKAGVPDTAIGKLFVKSYDGELDVEAVKAEWSSLSAEFAPTPAPAPASAPVQEAEVVEPTPEEVSAQQTQDLISGGAPPEAVSSNHPGMDGAKQYHELLQSGVNQDEAFSAWMGQVIQGNLNGDERVQTERRGGTFAL